MSFKRLLHLLQKEMDLVFLEQLTLKILPLALEAPIRVKKIYIVFPDHYNKISRLAIQLLLKAQKSINRNYVFLTTIL